MSPAGAMTKKEFEAEPRQRLYVVYAVSHPNGDARAGLLAGPIQLLETTYPNEWFNGKYGYFFSNYFHALAYSLKQKAENESKRNHSQATRP